MSPSASLFTLPVVDDGARSTYYPEDMRCRNTHLGEVLPGIRVLTDLWFVGCADGQVLQDLRGRMDQLTRIVVARRDDDNIAGFDGAHLASNSERSSPFQDHKHLFLRVVQVIRAGAFAWRYDVDACRELLCCHSLGEPGVTALVFRLQRRVPKLDFLTCESDERQGRLGMRLAVGVTPNKTKLTGPPRRRPLIQTLLAGVQRLDHGVGDVD